MTRKTEDTHTAAVLAVMAATPDPRLREIMTALVKHLHAFAQEVRLTDAEFRTGIAKLVAMGQQSNDSHNEVMLMSGSLGLSQLVLLMNNTTGGENATSASLLGPFWRLNAPRIEHGDSIIRSDTPGTPLHVRGRVVDLARKPVAGAEVDVWHSSPAGFYENQDETQVDMNLRGRLVTDADGRFDFWTVKPAGYPIPIDGVVGELVKAQGRRHFRPAHLHALIHKPGFKTIASQIYTPDDPDLHRDVQFGVLPSLIAQFKTHAEPAPRPGIASPWESMDYTFVVEAGEAVWPRPPIR
jgi:catechol 1,2-dioxygenase